MLALTLALSQRERGQFPFSLREKGGDGVGVVGWIKSRRDGSTINEIIRRLFFALRAVVAPMLVAQGQPLAVFVVMPRLIHPTIWS